MNDDGERTIGTPNWCFHISDSPDEELERDCIKFKFLTNYDRIVSKSTEELAKWIARQTTAAGRIVPDGEYKFWLDWLKQEVHNV